MFRFGSSAADTWAPDDLLLARQVPAGIAPSPPPISRYQAA
jgi:hypothetical protein